MRGRLLVVALFALGFMLLAGCTEPTPTVPPDDPPPGQVAPAVVDPAAPELCRALVDSPAIRSISGSIAGLSSDDASAARSQLGVAADELRRLADGSELSAQLTSAADALDSLAAGDATAEISDAVQTAMGQLGEGAQQLCDFPVG